MRGESEGIRRVIEGFVLIKVKHIHGWNTLRNPCEH
jgi:hypothetical protein